MGCGGGVLLRLVLPFGRVSPSATLGVELRSSFIGFRLRAPAALTPANRLNFRSWDGWDGYPHRKIGSSGDRIIGKATPYRGSTRIHGAPEQVNADPRQGLTAEARSAQRRKRLGPLSLLIPTSKGVSVGYPTQGRRGIRGEIESGAGSPPRIRGSLELPVRTSRQRLRTVPFRWPGARWCPGP
jgi:hypothetical protein